MVPGPSVLPTMDLSAILEGVTASAAAIVAPKGAHPGLLLRKMVGGAPPNYVALSTGSLGGFPYYWQDPSSLLFNAETYHWIDSAVDGGAVPARLSGPFTNLAITALGSIRFTLSAVQQNQLDTARAEITTAQSNLLTAWQAAFGSTWAGQPSAPIDVVLQTIATNWENPPGAIQDLFAAPDLAALLSRAPSQGAAVLPALSAYLAAVAGANQWTNLVSRQRGYLQAALAALQQPTSANGGLLLNNQSVAPAYQVLTSVSDILAGLAGANAGLTTSLVARPADNGASLVTLNGKMAATGDPASLLALETNAGVELAGAAIGAATDPVSIAARFEGVTQVMFRPVPFDGASMTGWFWSDAILQAGQPGAANAGGFSFSPTPPFDFSPQGQFGWLMGLLIARSPVLSVGIDGASAVRIAAAVNGGDGATLSFLGQNLSAPGTESDYRAVVIPPQAGGQATLQIAPASPSAPNLGSRAYVLGGIVQFIDA